MSYFLLYMIFVYNKTCAKVFCGWLAFCLLFTKMGREGAQRAGTWSASNRQAADQKGAITYGFKK